MKLKYILSELGDSLYKSNDYVSFNSNTAANTSFKFENNTYNVYVKFLNKNVNNLIIEVHFSIIGNDGEPYEGSTNLNQPYKIIGHVLGCIINVLEKYSNRLKLPIMLKAAQISGLKEKEKDNVNNRREKLYSNFVKKFAQSMGSSVILTYYKSKPFYKFNPSIKIDNVDINTHNAELKKRR